jgi:hypothetical protein
VERSFVKEKTFNSGKTILTVSCHADTLLEFIRQHTNAKGYINFGISKTKEVGKYGQTHCLWLDTWEPNKEGQPRAAASAPRAAARPASKPATEIPDDVPF